MKTKQSISTKNCLSLAVSKALIPGSPTSDHLNKVAEAAVDFINVFRGCSEECRELKTKNKKAQAWARVAKEMEMTSFFKNINNPKYFVFPLFCSSFRHLCHKSRRYNNTRYLGVSAAILAERTEKRTEHSN